MEEQKTQLIAKLKEAKNVLVTVSRDPSVDQLSAAIGMTIALNRLDKHATAVYSGTTPSTLEFLRPEDTLEQTTDSLRDFIIALDKSKADKLRYKVEDQVVRIFITPYHTAISEADLDFSQGDFNVDVVVALGVKTQQDIDEAVQAHGRILHDATVAVLSTEGEPELGTLNVVDSSASSLSEIVLGILEHMSKKVLDTQIATALLTGIVAMTDRFSNDRTTPQTMSASATLMAAGANQQLITSELAKPEPEAEFEEMPADNDGSDGADDSTEAAEVPARDPGTLEINHNSTEAEEAPAELPDVAYDDTEEEEISDQPQIHVDESGKLSVLNQDMDEDNSAALPSLPPQPELPKVEVKRGRMAAEPSFDQPLSANTEEEPYGPPSEQLTQPTNQTPILSHNEHVLAGMPAADGQEDAASQPTDQPAPPEAADQPEAPAAPPVPDVPAAQDEDAAETAGKTLAEIEQEVDSPHLHSGVDDKEMNADGAGLDEARNAVDAALQTSGSSYTPEPITALNAQPLGYELHENEPDVPAAPDAPLPTPPPTDTSAPASAPSTFPGTPPPAADDEAPAPPPVAPPFYPPAA